MFDKDKSKKIEKLVASPKEENDDNNNQFNISALDDGEFAFMEWLNSENKTSS